MSEGSAQKKTSTCAVSALLRTRIDQGVPQGRFLDPTPWVGLQAPTALLAPSGYSIGSSKGSPFHEHRRGLYGRHRPYSRDFTMSAGAMQAGRKRPHPVVADARAGGYNDADDKASDQHARHSRCFGGFALCLSCRLCLVSC